MLKLPGSALVQVTLLCLTVSACGGERGAPVSGVQASPASLIDHQAWMVTGPSSDPLVSHRPSVVNCDDLTSWGPEEDYVEVDTGRCNYLMIEQPTLVSGAIGDHVKGSITHFDLTAPESATAHLAVLIQERVVFERTIAVPGPADVFSFDEILTAPFEKGEPVYLHVHNHGQNNWRLYELTLVPAP